MCLEIDLGVCMKNLSLKICLVVVALFGVVSAGFASNLPDCPSDKSVRWDNCFGTMTFSDGGKYHGEYEDDKRSGQGTYTYYDGGIYIGQWKNREKNGQGIYTYADGSVEEGIWKDDEFQYAKPPIKQVPLIKTPTKDNESYICELNAENTKGWIPSTIQISFNDDKQLTRLWAADYSEYDLDIAKVLRYTKDFREVKYIDAFKDSSGKNVSTIHTITILPKLNNKISYTMKFSQYSNQYIARGKCKKNELNQTKTKKNLEHSIQTDFKQLTSAKMVACYNGVITDRAKYLIINPDFLARAWGYALGEFAPKSSKQKYFNKLQLESDLMMSKNDADSLLTIGNIEKCLDSVNFSDIELNQTYNDYKSANKLFLLEIKSGKQFSYKAGGRYLLDDWLAEIVQLSAKDAPSLLKAHNIGQDFFQEWKALTNDLLKEYGYDK